MIRTFIRDNRRYAATSDHNSKRSPSSPGKSYDAAEQQNLRQTISLLGVPTDGRGTRTREHQCEMRKPLAGKLILRFSWWRIQFNPLASPLGFLPSLDHSVRSRQHIRRNREPDLFSRLQIDDEFELRRLLHRQIGRLGSLQDLVHEICDAPVAVREVRPVRHEPANVYISSAAVHRR